MNIPITITQLRKAQSDLCFRKMTLTLLESMDWRRLEGRPGSLCGCQYVD